MKAETEVLHYGSPSYKDLSCKKCGNTREFIEYAFRDTKQPFVMIGMEPDWDLYEDYGSEDAFPNEIVCAVCERKGVCSVVWKPQTSTPTSARETSRIHREGRQARSTARRR